MKKIAKNPLFWFAVAALLVVADQLVKLWVRGNMTLGETRDFIPLVELFYVENTGGAFSIFSGYTWVLALVSAVVAGALGVALWKDWLTTGWFSRLALTLVLSGAVGNLIDRVAFQKVTDMFNFTFIRFGVFNVADIWVTVGVFAFVLYLIFGPREGKEKKNHEADDPN